MEKEELMKILGNGMTVEEVIKQLEQYDKGTLVINGRSMEYLPVSEISETHIDYCYDEIIKRDVVSIY